MSDFLIYDYIPPALVPSDRSKSPEHIDFVTAPNERFERVETMVKGEIVQIDHFAKSFGPTEAEDSLVLVVRETFEYQRESGDLVQRVHTPKWTVEGSTTENPVFGTTFTQRIKPYNEQQRDRADERRRNNIVRGLKAQSRSFGAESENQQMFIDLSAELFAYEQSGNTSLIAAIGTYSPGAPWLDDLLNTKPGYELYPTEAAPGVALTVRAAIMDALTL